MTHRQPPIRTTPTRRQILAGGLALAAPALVASAGLGATATGAPIRIGAPLPLSGARARDGVAQQRALELAVAHVNGQGDGGMLAHFSSRALGGRGLLGRPLEARVADTRSQVRAAELATLDLITGDGAAMITGGASSGVAAAMQAVCDLAGVPFMIALAHANGLTGANRSAYGYRHFFNAYMSGAALVPHLAKTVGAGGRAAHLTADYSWGHSVEQTLTSATEALGWTTATTVGTAANSRDFSTAVPVLLAAEPDVIFLNQYGASMIAALEALLDAGLTPDGPAPVKLVAPLLTDQMARGVAGRWPGLLGTANWHAGLDDPASAAFVHSFRTAFGTTPGQSAHTVYCQVLLWADACARAGSPEACAVGQALSDFRFSGLGSGSALYRGGDGQCLHDVCVVATRAAADAAQGHLRMVGTVPAHRVHYGLDHPMFAAQGARTCRTGRSG